MKLPWVSPIHLSHFYKMSTKLYHKTIKKLKHNSYIALNPQWCSPTLQWVPYRLYQTDITSSLHTSIQSRSHKQALRFSLLARYFTAYGRVLSWHLIGVRLWENKCQTSHNPRLDHQVWWQKRESNPGSWDLPTNCLTITPPMHTNYAVKEMCLICCS